MLIHKPSTVNLIGFSYVTAYHFKNEKSLYILLNLQKYVEPKIIVMTATMTEDINRVVDKLSKETPQIISGSKNEKIEVIEQEDLIRVYANVGKVFAVTDKDEYTIRLRLYEI